MYIMWGKYISYCSSSKDFQINAKYIQISFYGHWICIWLNRAVLFKNIDLHPSFNSSSNCHIFSCFFLIMLQTISPFKCSKWNCSFLKHVFKLFNFHLWRTINISNIFMQAFKRVRLRVIEKIKSKYAENQNAFRLFGV